MQNASMKNSPRKESAISFLKLAASGNVSEAYAKYISPNFRHHNPYFAGDAESLKKGMAEATAKFPDTTLEVQHIFEEGELVAVHSRVQHGSGEPEISVVHISALKAIGLRSCGTWARSRRLTRQISMGCS